MNVIRFLIGSMLFLILAAPPLSVFADGPAEQRGLTLEWQEQESHGPRSNTWLVIHGDGLPAPIRIHYLEAYVRPNSTDEDWLKSIFGHRTELVAMSDDGRCLRVKDTLSNGLVVEHVITAGVDEVDFRLTATNPTEKTSQAHWAQPCVRVGEFTGTGPEQTSDAYAYLAKSFVFLNNELVRMPTPEWALKARYTPGQVWCPQNVPRSDVNPRPLSPLVPSNGLIGCFNADESKILALAFEPYQELFQGVARCLHSDFRLGEIKPGETVQIHGKLYVVENDVPALLKRYQKDFPQHVANAEASDRE
ncbi:hypothetical protein GYB59_19735 [bacterium]|nr:hypothetical protein [bacterium]